MTKQRTPMGGGKNATPVPCCQSPAIPAPASSKEVDKVVSIEKPSKVVPFSSTKPRFIASDQESNRTIFAIGSQRFALDLSTRVTELPPSTGDFPAPVL